MYRLLARSWFLALGLVLSIHTIPESDAQTSSASRLSAHPWAKNTPWADWLSWAEQKIATCRSAKSSLAPRDCARFAGEALAQVYRAQSFAAQGTSPSNNTVAATVRDTRSGWIRLGSAADQTVLETAQREANRGQPVIATMAAGGQDHIAVILPGELKYSSTWRLKVPRTAIVFIGNPKRSYFGKPLSFGFSLAKGRDLELYVRPITAVAKGESRQRGQAIPHSSRAPVAKAKTQTAVGAFTAQGHQSTASKDQPTASTSQPAASTSQPAASMSASTAAAGAASAPAASSTTADSGASASIPTATASASTTTRNRAAALDNPAGRTYDVSQILARLSEPSSPAATRSGTARAAAADSAAQHATATGATVSEAPKPTTAAAQPQTQAADAPAADTKSGSKKRSETDGTATAAPEATGSRDIGDAGGARQQAAQPTTKKTPKASGGGGNREAYRSPFSRSNRTATAAAAQRRKPGLMRRNKIADHLVKDEPLEARAKPPPSTTKQAAPTSVPDVMASAAAEAQAADDDDGPEPKATAMTEAPALSSRDAGNVTAGAPEAPRPAAGVDGSLGAPIEAVPPDQSLALASESTGAGDNRETPAAVTAELDGAAGDSVAGSIDALTDSTPPMDAFGEMEYGADPATITAAVPIVDDVSVTAPVVAQGDADTALVGALGSTTVPVPTPAATNQALAASAAGALVPEAGVATTVAERGTADERTASRKPVASTGSGEIAETRPGETAAKTHLTLDDLARASVQPPARQGDAASVSAEPETADAAAAQESPETADATAAQEGPEVEDAEASEGLVIAADAAATTDLALTDETLAPDAVVSKEEQLAKVDPKIVVDDRLSGTWCDKAKIAGTNQVWAVLIDSLDKTLSWGVVETDKPDSFKALASRTILKLTRQGQLVGITFSKSDAAAGGLTAYFIFDGTDKLLETHVFDPASNEIYEKGAVWERCL